jgi:hypothetical protein
VHAYVDGEEATKGENGPLPEADPNGHHQKSGAEEHPPAVHDRGKRPARREDPADQTARHRDHHDRQAPPFSAGPTPVEPASEAKDILANREQPEQ